MKSNWKSVAIVLINLSYCYVICLNNSYLLPNLNSSISPVSQKETAFLNIAESNLYSSALDLRNALNKIIEPPFPSELKQNYLSLKSLREKPILFKKLHSNFISPKIPIVRNYKLEEIIYPFHSFM